MVVLESSKLFNGLSASEFEKLRSTVQVQSFSAGKVIFREGDDGDGLYMIKTGRVLISALVNQDERRTLSNLGPGDFFGEMAVLDNEPRSATAASVEDTEVYLMPRCDIIQLLESSPKLAVNLMREFSRRLREFNRRYIQEVLQAERLTLVGRFARSIVHDFKNPLNVIGIASDLAGMENATASMRQMARTRIRKQVDRLSNMINELLEFTRGTQSSIIPAQTDYAVFVQQFLQEISVEMTENSVLIECENEPPSISLLFDPSRLQHVFSNLIHNALDAMPNGGKIKLRFALTENEVITELEDSGKGIPPEIAPQLFEAFATYGKAQGTGLGLSICKKIVEDHRGRIQARNAPGRGAIFSFSIPLKRP
ncbi:MAG: cyclic nucleotide-binding domain-containing protein [Pedosphaera sp.]|nr:cyclic nucleotide-binding domain-containing protein [Pedosphaera sp.]